MLLRSSRVADRLTKHAFLGQAVKGALSAGKNIASLIPKPVKALGAAALTVGPIAAEGIGGIRNAKQGVSNKWLSAANAGTGPHAPQF